MTNIPKISEAEWEIMKIIWKDNPITAENIIHALPKDIMWTEQTVRTFLNRLLKKEAIVYERSGRSYEYYPLISEKESRRAESESFLKRVFSGAAGMMVTNFLEEAQLSEKEIDDLQKLLQDKQKKNHERGDKC